MNVARTSGKNTVSSENALQQARDALAGYQIDGAYDEMMAPNGELRPAYRNLCERLFGLGAEELNGIQQSADLSFLYQGITFTVYGKEEGIERVFPFDLIPRIITSSEWNKIETGLE